MFFGLIVKLLLSSVAAISLAISAFLCYLSPVQKPFPKPTGIYSVGETSYHFVDENSKDPHSGGLRELMVHVWYPCQRDVADHETYPYAPTKVSAMKDQFNRQFKVPKFLLNVLFRGMRVHAIPDAKVLDVGEKYPVLIFSHGFGENCHNYTIFLEELASHGYVVVGIDHTYACNITVFPDGRVISLDKMFVDMMKSVSMREMGIVVEKELSLWIDDVRFVLDKLLQVNGDEGGLFCNKLDLGRIGVFGHSGGGAVAAEMCVLDSRCKAGINIDGELLAGRHDAVMEGDTCKNKRPSWKEIPFLFLVAENGPLGDKPLEDFAQEMVGFRKKLGIGSSETLEDIVKYYEENYQKMVLYCESVDGAKKRIVVKEAGHATFSNYILMKFPLAKIFKTEVADPYKKIADINDCIRFFFDQHLKGRVESKFDDGLLHSKDLVFSNPE